MKYFVPLLIGSFLLISTQGATLQRSKRWIQETGFGRPERDTYGNYGYDDQDPGIDKRAASSSYQKPNADSELFGKYPDDNEFGQFGQGGQGGYGGRQDEDVISGGKPTSGGGVSGGNGIIGGGGYADEYGQGDSSYGYPTTTYRPWYKKVGRFLKDKYHYLKDKIRNYRDTYQQDENDYYVNA